MPYGQQANRQVYENSIPDPECRNIYRHYLVTGACECVSLAGPLLGGGHGYLQGFYGLISDNLISARVVLASGNVVVVSATQNPGASEVLDFGSDISRGIRHLFPFNIGTDYITQISFGASKEQDTILELSLRLQVKYTTSQKQIGLTYSIYTRMTRLRLSSHNSIIGLPMDRKTCPCSL